MKETSGVIKQRIPNTDLIKLQFAVSSKQNNPPMRIELRKILRSQPVIGYDRV